MTNDQFEKLANLIKTAHDDLAERLDGHDENFESMAQKFDKVDARFDNLEQDMTNLKSQVSQLSTDSRSHTQVIRTLQASVDNLNGIIKENDYLLTRIAHVEKHVGIKPPVVSEFA